MTGCDPPPPRRPDRQSLPARGGCQAVELKALRAEVMRLRGASERDAKEKEELVRRVDLLKAELRRVLEENRILTDAVDQQKCRLAQATAREEAALRESALDSARELFRSMLDAGGAVTGGSASAPTPPPVPPATALGGPMSGAFRAGSMGGSCSVSLYGETPTLA
eukprot:CAMPEP_0172707782 /NCGR_PEP_ID=MMETSP1074-20121228/50175_1 /TAXON_ID=2916 /ORGANISM="Ceratium fusus, Strain PA161109" /LENGTH=165 /DNA_ID=CAMNT_0013530639 /DNA_START=37 /DNA_END=534 /DNA_ORIENTATION=+